MTFSREWNSAQLNGQRPDHGMTAQMHWLVSTFVGSVKGQRVLELGSASGLSAQLILSAGGEYYGIDGREDAVQVARKVEGAHFHCGDFTMEQPFGGDFDVVIDRASIAHNDIGSIKRCLGLVWESLKPGGLFLSADWFSSSHSELQRGEVVEAMTHTDYHDGQFAGVGRVHFSSERELVELFDAFEPLYLSERISRRPQRGLFLPTTRDAPWISPYFIDKDYQVAVWDLVVRRPK